MSDFGSGWQPWTLDAAREWIAVPAEKDDKYSRGVLGVITGSDQYPGAAVLGVEAAVRTGVGMVRYVGPPRAENLVLQRRPEVVSGVGRVQAWLVGSGIDRDSRATSVTDTITSALGKGDPAVIDSGALDLIWSARGAAVITPRYRELSFVLGSNGHDVSADAIAADPEGWAVRAADLLAVTVLLKGHTTFVASPEGARITISTGTSWLATAGSGDVLAGILGALVATHVVQLARDPLGLAYLAATAATLHGLASVRASCGGPIAALDVAEALPLSIAELIGSTD
jgi:ADP-dependent NAD(P)H-hydrate dehydratase / NAD(P)H-hydrate epimerase